MDLSEFISLHQLNWAKEFEAMFVGLHANRIIHMHYKSNAIMSLDCAKEIVQYIGQQGNGQAFPNLVVLAPGCSISKEAGSFSKSEAANIYTLADAIVVKNAGQRILGNIYINFGRPSRPTKLFSNKEQALKWLTKFSAK